MIHGMLFAFRKQVHERRFEVHNRNRQFQKDKANHSDQNRDEHELHPFAPL